MRNKALPIILILLLSFLVLPQTVLASTLYESYTTGVDNAQGLGGTQWRGQTFTPSTSHAVISVSLLLYRDASPGTITVGIRATSAGLPTGGDLCSGTTDGNALTTNASGEWKDIVFSSTASVSASTKYVIVVRSASSGLLWRNDGSSATYAGGNYVGSTDGGSTWGINIVNEDFLFKEYGADAPTVTTQATTSIETTTATGNGNITAIGDVNPTIRGICYSSVNNPPTTADSKVEENGSFGTGAYTESLTGLSGGTTYYARAYATSAAGTSYGSVDTFLTKPDAPTDVAASEDEATKVVITWTKSTSATDYHVWRDAVDLGSAGDVATFDDTGASAPTITAGTTVATDGTVTLAVDLSLTGTSANDGTSHSYKVVASNATGSSADSTTDDGYRAVGTLTYQWQRSAADSDASYSNIVGATSSTYHDTGAPADGAGRYYKCVLNADGATAQTSPANRGYAQYAPISSHYTGLEIVLKTTPTILFMFLIIGIIGLYPAWRMSPTLRSHLSLPVVFVFIGLMLIFLVTIFTNILTSISELL